jgi:hypothetical protein
MFVPALYPNDENCYMLLNLQSEMVGLSLERYIVELFYLVTKSADGIPRYELCTVQRNIAILYWTTLNDKKVSNFDVL